MRKWHLTSKDIDLIVEAETHTDAFNSLRDFGKFRFGILVEAREVGASEEEGIPARTSLLMARWGRREESWQFSKLAERQGLGFLDDVALVAKESK